MGLCYHKRNRLKFVQNRNGCFLFEAIGLWWIIKRSESMDFSTENVHWLRKTSFFLPFRVFCAISPTKLTWSNCIYYHRNHNREQAVNITCNATQLIIRLCQSCNELIYGYSSSFTSYTSEITVKMHTKNKGKLYIKSSRFSNVIRCTSRSALLLFG